MRGTLVGRVVGSSFGVGVALVAGLALAHPATAAAPASPDVPDWTYAACAGFDSSALPEFTHTGECVSESGVIVPVSEDDSIPHCAVSDDYNDGSQDLCYGIDMQDKVYVLNSHDHYVSRGEE